MHLLLLYYITVTVGQSLFHHKTVHIAVIIGQTLHSKTLLYYIT